MNIIVRNMNYGQLLNEISGRKVLIWTCNTCAKHCNGIGGVKSMEQLAERLSKDGVTVTGICWSMAACIKAHVSGRIDPELLAASDVILCVTCRAGETLLGNIVNKDIINPTDTLGTGYEMEPGEIYLTNGTRMNGTSTMFGPFGEE